MIGYSKETKEEEWKEKHPIKYQQIYKLFTFFGHILAVLLPCYFPFIESSIHLYT